MSAREEVKRTIKAYATLVYGNVSKMSRALGLNSRTVYCLLQGSPTLWRLREKIADDMQSKGYKEFAEVLRS